MLEIVKNLTRPELGVMSQKEDLSNKEPLDIINVSRYGFYFLGIRTTCTPSGGETEEGERKQLKKAGGWREFLQEPLWRTGKSEKLRKNQRRGGDNK